MIDIASSGTINNTFRTGYAIRIVWSVSTQDIAANTSTVTASVQLVSLGSSYNIVSSASKTGSLTINGVSYSFSFNASLSGNQTKTLFTKTVKIAHNSDGTKTCSMSCNAGINVTLSGTYYGTVTASGSGVFDTIPRASTISSITANVSVNGTNTVGIGIARASSSFTHTVVISFGSYSQTITGVTTATSYAIPMTWLNAIPNAITGTATATLTTYNGSTKIGNATSKTFTITVPDTVVPTISGVSIYEATEGIAAQFNAFVQNRSKLNIQIVAAGAYSSTIKSYKTTVDGVDYHGNPANTGILTKSGSREIKIIVTDSRGRTATAYRYRDVVAYELPTISRFIVYRSNSTGTQVYEGCCVTASMKFDISSVNSANTKTYTIEYKLKSSNTWTTLASGSVYSYDDTMVFHEILTTDNSYDLRLTVTDFFGSAVASATLPTAFTLIDMNASGKGLALGKVSEKNAFECALEIYDRTDVAIRNGLALYEYAGQTDPDTTQEHLILTAVNIPTNGFYYVMTFFYSNRTGNRAQIAVPYNQATKIYFRTYFDGTWSEWQ